MSGPTSGDMSGSTNGVMSDSTSAVKSGPTNGAKKYDALVVGSGIGGMESALKLGDMGYKVLVVEKEPSVGGKMILLSKVFPTLDCASCISTPKMARDDPPSQHRRADVR